MNHSTSIVIKILGLLHIVSSVRPMRHTWEELLQEGLTNGNVMSPKFHTIAIINEKELLGLYAKSTGHT